MKVLRKYLSTTTPTPTHRVLARQLSSSSSVGSNATAARVAKPGAESTATDGDAKAVGANISSSSSVMGPHDTEGHDVLHQGRWKYVNCAVYCV